MRPDHTGFRHANAGGASSPRLGASRSFSRLVRGVIALVAVGVIASAAWRTELPQRLWWLATAPPPSQYVLPVAGVKRAALRPSFGAPRPGNRRHQGIDIMARRGTAVVAAADGFVTSTAPNRLGGTVVWIYGAGHRMYYYAHLEEIAPGIRAGRFVAAGETIGSVGTSGNAAGGPPHLHFGIYAAESLLAATFAALDPFPLLQAG